MRADDTRVKKSDGDTSSPPLSPRSSFSDADSIDDLLDRLSAGGALVGSLEGLEGLSSREGTPQKTTSAHTIHVSGFQKDTDGHRRRRRRREGKAAAAEAAHYDGSGSGLSLKDGSCTDVAPDGGGSHVAWGPSSSGRPPSSRLRIQVTSSMTTTMTTAQLTGRNSASLASPRLPAGTPRTVVHAQGVEHVRWLEGLRMQYGHPTVAGTEGGLVPAQHALSMSASMASPRGGPLTPGRLSESAVLAAALACRLQRASGDLTPLSASDARAMWDGAARPQPGSTARSTCENPLFEWDGAPPSSGAASASAATAQSWLAQQGRSTPNAGDQQLPPYGEAAAYDTLGDSSCSVSEAGSIPSSQREAKRQLPSAFGADEGGRRRSRSTSPLEGGPSLLEGGPTRLSWGSGSLRAAYGVRATSPTNAEPSAPTAESAAAEPAAVAASEEAPLKSATVAAAEPVTTPAAAGEEGRVEILQQDGFKTLSRRQNRGAHQHSRQQRSAPTLGKHAAAKKAGGQQKGGARICSKCSGASTRLWLSALLLLAALLTGGYLLAHHSFGDTEPSPNHAPHTLHMPSAAPQSISHQVPATPGSPPVPEGEVGAAPTQPAVPAPNLRAVAVALDPPPAPVSSPAPAKAAAAIVQPRRPEAPPSIPAPKPVVLPKVRAKLAKPAPRTEPRLVPQQPARSAAATVRPEPATSSEAGHGVPAAGDSIEAERKPADSVTPAVGGPSLGPPLQLIAGAEELAAAPAPSASSWTMAAAAAAALAGLALCGVAAALLMRRVPGTELGGEDYESGGGGEQGEYEDHYTGVRVPGGRSQAPDGRRHTLATSAPLLEFTWLRSNRVLTRPAAPGTQGGVDYLWLRSRLILKLDPRRRAVLSHSPEVHNLGRDVSSDSPMSQLRSLPYDNPRSYRNGAAAAADSSAMPAVFPAMRRDTATSKATRRQTFA